MQRNSLIESMRHVLFSAGGSFLTRQAAEHTLECFARYMKEEGFVHLRDVSQVNGNAVHAGWRRRGYRGRGSTDPPSPAS